MVHLHPKVGITMSGYTSEARLSQGHKVIGSVTSHLTCMPLPGGWGQPTSLLWSYKMPYGHFQVQILSCPRESISRIRSWFKVNFVIALTPTVIRSKKVYGSVLSLCYQFCYEVSIPYRIEVGGTRDGPEGGASHSDSHPLQDPKSAGCTGGSALSRATFHHIWEVQNQACQADNAQ